MVSKKKEKNLRSILNKNFENFFCMHDILKKKALQNNYILKFLGLINEYIGKHLMALKLYFIFIQTNIDDKIYQSRMNLICFWENILKFRMNKLSNISLKNIFLFSESIVFNIKIQQQKCNWTYSIFLLKKFERLNFLKFKIVKFSQKSNILMLIYFNFFIRALRTGKKTNGKKKRVGSFLSIQKENFKISIILFFLTLQNYFQIKKNNSFKKKKFHYVFQDFILPKKVKKPMIFEIWKNMSMNKVKNHLKKDMNIFFHLMTIHFKWFINIGIQWVEKKIIFFPFFMRIFSIKNFENLSESYNPVFRNFRLQNNFFSKIAMIKIKNGFFSEAFNLFEEIGKKNLKSVKLLNLLALVKEKIYTKKNNLNSFIKGLKTFFRKKIITSKKFFQKNNSALKIIKNIEKLFELGKIYGLSRIIISILLLKNQKIFSFIRFNEKYKKKTKEKKKIKLSLKTYMNKIFFFENSLKFMGKKNFQKFLNSFFGILAELIFFFLQKNQIFSKDKSLNFLISNNLFYRESSFFIRHFGISILIKKKKFKKAYQILRIQCIKNPFSFNKWCLLGKLENQLGFLIAKTLRFSLRLLIKYPNSVPAMIFTGNHCSFFGSYGYSLAEYFQAFKWKKDSPFLNFLISIQYLNGSLSRRILNSEFSIFISLSFFSEYKRLRFFMCQVNLERNVWSKYLEFELLYNTARLYLFLGLNHQALKIFQKGLRWSNVMLTINKTKRRTKKFNQNNLKKEILFNIFILFRTLGNNFLFDYIE